MRMNEQLPPPIEVLMDAMRRAEVNTERITHVLYLGEAFIGGGLWKPHYRVTLDDGSRSVWFLRNGQATQSKEQAEGKLFPLGLSKPQSKGSSMAYTAPKRVSEPKGTLPHLKVGRQLKRLLWLIPAYRRAKIRARLAESAEWIESRRRWV